MSQLKRKSSFDNLPRKFQSQSISCFEDLSNECFYEIFDYLEACQIYEIFSELNSRFYQLIKNLSILFRIQLDCTQLGNKYFDHFQQMLIHHRHQIYSIRSSDVINMSRARLFSSLDSFCNRLESVVFDRTTSDILIRLLRQYSCLPRLFSLNINMDHRLTYKQIIDIYRAFFSLSKLKSLTFRTLITNEFNVRFALSIAKKDEYTHIQYLYLDQRLDLTELFSILSYTPELSQLIVSCVIDDKQSNINNRMQISLLNLRYFSITTYDSDLDELEEFFRKINCKLEIFNIMILYENDNYINANQWQMFIQNDLPYLKRLSLSYYEVEPSRSEILHDTSQLKQFFSSFWIQRQMIFQIDILYRDIRYSISPYRKNWYSNYEQMNSCIKLYLDDDNFEQTFSLLKSHIEQILHIGQIDYLRITNIRSDTLVKILHLIPQLSSLKISSLIINEYDLIEKYQNQITKVNLQKMIHMKEIDFLLEVFSHMNYLRIGSTDNIDIQVFFRHIIHKINTISNHQLRYIFFHVSAADDHTIQILRTMIQSEQLLLDYTIKRIRNYIDVQWK